MQLKTPRNSCCSISQEIPIILKNHPHSSPDISLETVTLKRGIVRSWLIIRGLFQFYSRPRTIFIQGSFCLSSPNELTQPTLLLHRLQNHEIRNLRPKIVPPVQWPKDIDHWSWISFKIFWYWQLIDCECLYIYIYMINMQKIWFIQEKYINMEKFGKLFYYAII